MIKSIQNKEIKLNITYALFTYVLMIASIIFINIPFIESKIKKTDSKTEIIKKSLLYSGLLGLCIYGIYSGTNLAVFQNYDIGLGLKDTLWGFILYTIVTTTYFLIAWSLNKHSLLLKKSAHGGRKSRVESRMYSGVDEWASLSKCNERFRDC